MSPSDKVSRVLAAAALAVAMVAGFEGHVNHGYLDPVNIPTDCFGHTGPDVKVGQTKTDDQCMASLAHDLVSHGLAIQPCIKVPVPDPSMAAFISFSYNVGARAFCQSTLVKKLNGGDLAGACAELSKWTKAKGQVWPGLVKRRAAERAYCERGLK